MYNCVAGERFSVGSGFWRCSGYIQTTYFTVVRNGLKEKKLSVCIFQNISLQLLSSWIGLVPGYNTKRIHITGKINKNHLVRIIGKLYLLITREEFLTLFVLNLVKKFPILSLCLSTNLFKQKYRWTRLKIQGRGQNFLRGVNAFRTKLLSGSIILCFIYYILIWKFSENLHGGSYITPPPPPPLCFYEQYSLIFFMPVLVVLVRRKKIVCLEEALSEQHCVHSSQLSKCRLSSSLLKKNKNKKTFFKYTQAKI